MANTKRIAKELEQFNKNENSNLVYLCAIDDNLLDLRGLIIGPSDTPFEGEKAFKLLEEYINHEKQNTPPPPPPPPPQPIYHPQAPQEIDDNSMSRLQPAKLPQKSSMQQNQKLINMSSLEDLGDAVESREHSIEAPHKAQNKNVHFDIEQENQQRNAPERSLKQGGNIVSIALQMQKDREEAPSGRPPV